MQSQQPVYQSIIVKLKFVKYSILTLFLACSLAFPCTIFQKVLFNFAVINYYKMKIITIEEDAWKQLNSRIDAIAEYLKRLENTSYDDLWLNNHEVCQYLHISEKTLWRMRTKGEIAYSKIYGQYFYTIGAIKDMLNANAVQSSDEYVEELMAKGKSYIEKGRRLKTDKK